MVLLIMDCSNAFPTLSHNFARAVLDFIPLKQGFVDLILSSLLSSCFFLVGNSVNKSHVFRPGAGIRPGDLFSPLLFSYVLPSYVYSDLVGYQTSDIRLLWTITPPPPPQHPFYPPPPRVRLRPPPPRVPPNIRLVPLSPHP